MACTTVESEYFPCSDVLIRTSSNVPYISMKIKLLKHKPTHSAGEALCVVKARVYNLGEQFREGCNVCTCRGRNKINCSPTSDCEQGEKFY